MTVGLRVLRSGRRRAGAQRRDRAFAHSVRLLAADLDAGARPAEALGAAAAADPVACAPLRQAATAAAAGGDAAVALLAAAEPSCRALGAAWRLGEVTGAGTANVVGRVADDLASREQQRRAVAVATAGPRSSALVLAALPAVGLLLGGAMGARPLDFLLGQPVGQVLCSLGALLDAGGVLWVERLVRRAEA